MAHGAGHAHGHAADLEPVERRRVIGLLTVLVVLLFGVTVVALVWLWPRADPATYLPEAGRFAVPGSVEATGAVTATTTFTCPGFGDETAPEGGSARTLLCGRISVLVGDGPDAGRTVEVEVTDLVLKAGLRPGDEVRVLRVPTESGEPTVYAYSDIKRDLPLGLLALIFAVSVVLVARVRGLLALVGLGLSFAVIVKFLLPNLLIGRSPILVGMVAAAAIMFVVLYLAHGVSVRTTTALVGTLSGLAVAAGLGTWAVGAAKLTGGSSDESFAVTAFSERVSLTGLLLAGIAIAGLGVLNDVTVTQASAVWELHALEPNAGAGRLFAGAMRIGRDHIASSVYTIAFVYAGSSLPVLLLITMSQRPLGLTLTSEALAGEVVSTLVGAIALVLSVPLTTGVGAVLVTIAAAGRSGRSGRTGRTGGRRRSGRAELTG